MGRRKILTFLVVAALVAIGGIDQAYSGAGPAGTTWYANSPLGIIPPGTAVGAGNDTGAALTKFIDALPGLGYANRNNAGQYIPVANPDTTTYPAADFYKIVLRDYTVKFHPNLAKASKLRGYYQYNAGTVGSTDNNSRYLGPLIIAQKGRQVRIQFINKLGIGNAGNLFLPVDTTIMGAGLGPLGAAGGNYTQNRATLHLHGGFTPWISDGTPHQWITPVGENTTTYLKGVSQRNVPDMPNPGAGQGTFYWTNQQSNRLMFYHDHAYGLTRLNVYGGEAAGYLIWDQWEADLIDGTNIKGQNPGNVKAIPGFNGGVYKYGIPLVIQDKTFVPKDVATQDSKWSTANWGAEGDLWYPHIYEPNQTGSQSGGGASATGRWDYGPWFWPVFPATPLPGMVTSPTDYNTSIVPEAFMDTMVVNGAAYPYLSVQPQAYRFRILNGCNDRNINLSLFTDSTGGGTDGKAATATIANGAVATIVLSGASAATYTSAPGVHITAGGGFGATAVANLTPTTVAGFRISSGGTGYNAGTTTVTLVGGGAPTTIATATPIITAGVITGFTPTNPGAGYSSAPYVIITDTAATPGTGAVATARLTATSIANIAVTFGGAGYTAAPTVVVGSTREVKMVPAVQTNGFPAGWPTDGRDGGTPDPNTVGPAMLQIGSEGGFLPAPTAVNAQPVNYDYNRRNVVVLNVLEKALFMGPAERADVIIDFSQYAGKNIVLYNDAPAPVPAFDPRYDYYTGNPDQTASGGAPQTQVGQGPNTRTVMLFRVANVAGTPFNPTPLYTLLPAAYKASQPPPILPQPGYPAGWNAATPTYVPIQANTITYTPVGGGAPVTAPLRPKTIQELFDDYGRMNATLGTEVPFTTAVIQTTVPLKYIDPPTEGGNPALFPGAVPISNGQTQFWKITHNGVDTHSIHIHLVNWQVINRVGWDGAIRPPDPNELGWKETVRMHPLEDIVVAAKFTLPTSLPFHLPTSTRALDPTSPLGTTTQFSGFDGLGQPFTVTNALTYFGHEYVWHCHLLGHEENDMMRPIAINP